MNVLSTLKIKERIMTSVAISDHTEFKMQSQSARNIVLWVLQGLLAALFLFAGGMKLVMPIEVMTKQIAFPGLFVRFIGVAETLGALGLVLPWALRIRRELTPIAAVGLVIIMIGAVIVVFRVNGFLSALTPLIVGCLLVVVARGRWSAFTAKAGE
jgi:uncharacterized membrane protein YphA (DoxX/SURF4 family)